MRRMSRKTRFQMIKVALAMTQLMPTTISAESPTRSLSDAQPIALDDLSSV